MLRMEHKGKAKTISYFTQSSHYPRQHRSTHDIAFAREGLLEDVEREGSSGGAGHSSTPTTMLLAPPAPPPPPPPPVSIPVRFA